MMPAINLSILRWHCVQWLKQLSLPVTFALALIAFSVLAYLLYILPMLDQVDQNLAQTEAQLSMQSRTQSKTQLLNPSPANSSIQEKVALFYARFPTADTLPDFLEKINLEAEGHQLTLDKGDYKLKLLKTKSKNKVTTHSPLVPYEITLPIQGDYRHIRAFINESLSRLPMLAITDVQMQRDRIESKTIEARLRLVLFFSGQSKELRDGSQ